MSGRPNAAATIEGVVEALRRGHRQLTRNPRGAIESAVSQLLNLARTREPASAAAPQQDGDRTYRIDDLARASGVTVRNIRAYQERGLLHAPERRGRISLFDDSHLSRLRIITSMHKRGYASSHILEMLQAWEQGRNLADVLGLEQALVSPTLEDPSLTTTRSDAEARAGGAQELAQLIEAGLAESADPAEPDDVTLLRPRLIEAFAEMMAFGMDLDDLVALHLEVSEQVDTITRALVRAGFGQLAPRFLDQPENSADIEELVALLTRFRTLALTSVTATLSASIERSIESLLADYLANFLEHASQPAS